MSMRIGIDLGGTKTEGIVMDADGNIVLRVRTATPVKQGYEAIINNLVQLVNTLEKETGSQCRVGIGTPGALSSVTGRLKNSNTTCMNDKPVRQDLEKLLAREVRIENDANCFALSEATDGAGSNYNTVFGVIMGTGVGGGIVFNRQLHSGTQHIAGEWGHNVLVPDGPECYCGKKGCVETLISGPAVYTTYLALGGNKAGNVPEIVVLAENGDDIAEQSMQLFFEHYGKALAMVINILDPDAIVLGGGLSNIKRLYSDGRKQVAEHVFNDELRTAILPNQHGDSAGVRGAAWLWPPA